MINIKLFANILITANKNNYILGHIQNKSIEYFYYAPDYIGILNIIKRKYSEQFENHKYQEQIILLQSKFDKINKQLKNNLDEQLIHQNYILNGVSLNKYLN